ncbi:hypothetical protein SELR_pSRC500130 (plasmid) [Selenomonas ruminantium subsp. lactilytica TAM6421]|uniref:Uncharacterized protein n=1 Tax=Selenomonas ruminantium subsp. lactilytica (strain NBRC 103574 / TAM6421) TaxID=927704 RepID=I0GWQ0_SELRL|nr:hypothetical protein [Selenomonas ruminantium]BAL85187.1 hypothetical protein SELR_pSRC500130 [Selenomonas ruminantium subsp. lactilytica TAM6421]
MYENLDLNNENDLFTAVLVALDEHRYADAVELSTTFLNESDNIERRLAIYQLYQLSLKALKRKSHDKAAKELDEILDVAYDENHDVYEFAFTHTC